MAVKKTQADVVVGNPEAGIDPNWVTVEVQLCDSSNQVLQDPFSQVTATVSGLCGDDGQACPQTLSPVKGNVDNAYHLRVPAGKFVQIAVQGVSDDGATTSFSPLMASFSCGDAQQTVRLLEMRTNTAVSASENVTLTVQAHLCSKKARRHDRIGSAEIIRATAKPISADPVAKRGGAAAQEVLYHATMLGGSAIFSLPKGQYWVEIRLRGDYAGTCPSLPGMICVNGDMELPVCVDPCERVVAFFLVDGCGRQVTPSDLFAESHGRAVPIGDQGMYSLNGIEVGPLRLSSSEFDLSPREIFVDERMAQAHVIQASAKTHLEKTLQAGELQEILLDFEEALKADENAIIRILTLDGKLLDTLTPAIGHPTAYYSKGDQPLMFEAMVNGKTIDQFVHRPALKK